MSDVAACAAVLAGSSRSSTQHPPTSMRIARLMVAETCLRRFLDGHRTVPVSSTEGWWPGDALCNRTTEGTSQQGWRPPGGSQRRVLGRA